MQPTKNCPACSHDNYHANRYCSRCGAPLVGGTSFRRGLATVGIAALFCSAAFLFYRGATLTPETQAPLASVQPAKSVATPLPSPSVSTTPPPVRVATPAPTTTPRPIPSIAVPGAARGQGAAQEPEEVTVYVTRTGAKYHRAGCQYLRRSMIPVSLSEAKAEGYEPCSVCHPPPE
jgi:hypothetical protein